MKEKTWIDPLLRQLGNSEQTQDKLVCLGQKGKMERENDYKNTYPSFQWPLLGYGKGNLQQTRDSKNQRCREMAVGSEKILTNPSFAKSINEYI